MTMTEATIETDGFPAHTDALYEVLIWIAETTARSSKEAQGLRDAADWIEAHPGFGLDRWGMGHMIFVRTEAVVHGTYDMSDEEKVENRKALIPPFVRAFADGAAPGEMTKKLDEGTIKLKRAFGGVEIHADFDSEEICQLVPTGETKTETHYEIPDEVREQFQIPEEVRKQYKVDVEVPVLERQCPESLLKLDD